MARNLFANNAVGRLASGINSIATSITLEATQGALFPVTGAGDQFYLTIEDRTVNPILREIVLVTNHSGSSDTFTITRGHDGTLARSWSAGAYVAMRVTAAVLNELRDQTMATGRIKGRNAGTTGAVQDLTGTQVTAMLDQFSSSAKGLVPPPGPSTAKFLRDDGAWDFPAGSDNTVQYVTLAASTSLPQERVLAVESGVLTKTDGGAGGNITLGVATNGLAFSKLQQVATARFLGRTTAGTGDIEALTAAQFKTGLAITIADVATLQSSLDLKAALTYVDAGLNARVTTTTFSSYQATVAGQLAGKVDNSTFSAYQATVSSNLAAKADTATVNSQLALKADDAAAEKLVNKGQPLGYAELGADGKVPSAQLPSAIGLVASGVPFTPTGALSSTNVQAALAELDSEKADAAAFTAAMALKAPLASPALTGNPTAPTQSQGNNSTRIATTAYVDTGLATKANDAATTAALAGKMNQTSPTLTSNMLLNGFNILANSGAALKKIINIGQSQISLTATRTAPGQVALGGTHGITRLSSASNLVMLPYAYFSIEGQADNVADDYRCEFSWRYWNGGGWVLLNQDTVGVINSGKTGTWHEFYTQMFLPQIIGPAQQNGAGAWWLALFGGPEFVNVSLNVYRTGFIYVEYES